MDFDTGTALLALCEEENITIAEAMLRREEGISEQSREALREEMKQNLI